LIVYLVFLDETIFILGTVLFAVTGGTETSVKKVYMIDARTGDILTSFDSNPVGIFFFDNKIFDTKFDLSSI